MWKTSDILEKNFCTKMQSVYFIKMKKYDGKISTSVSPWFN